MPVAKRPSRSRRRHRPFVDPEVAKVFDSYPKRMRVRLMALRRLVFDTAATTDGVGELEEALRWGMPSYLTPQTKSGSTVRIHWSASEPQQYAMYFHCQTNLVSTFQRLYPRKFTYELKRAIVFTEDDEVPVPELSHCVALALTYHLNKRSRRAR